MFVQTETSCLTSCMTLPDFVRLVVFATERRSLSAGATEITVPAKWHTIPTMPCWCKSECRRPMIVLITPPSSQWKKQTRALVFRDLTIKPVFIDATHFVKVFLGKSKMLHLSWALEVSDRRRRGHDVSKPSRESQQRALMLGHAACLWWAELCVEKWSARRWKTTCTSSREDRGSPYENEAFKQIRQKHFSCKTLASKTAVLKNRLREKKNGKCK